MESFKEIFEVFVECDRGERREGWRKIGVDGGFGNLKSFFLKLIWSLFIS